MLTTLHPSAHPGFEKEAPNGSDDLFISQEPFLRLLSLERKRTERSGRRFVLMLLEAGALLKAGGPEKTLEKILCALFQSTRDTDVKGWYKAGAVIGVIFTEIGAAEGKSVTSALLSKISSALGCTLNIEQINEIRLSFHLFPEDWGHHGSGSSADAALYPDLLGGPDPRRGARLLKRSMDIGGSLFGLIVLSPLFALIAIAIKLTSKGPVLFRQERIGQYGKRFTFLKFRSMYAANDPTVHEEYMKRLIRGDGGADGAGAVAAASALSGAGAVSSVSGANGGKGANGGGGADGGNGAGAGNGTSGASWACAVSAGDGTDGANGAGVVSGGDGANGHSGVNGGHGTNAANLASGACGASWVGAVSAVSGAGAVSGGNGAGGANGANVATVVAAGAGNGTIGASRASAVSAAGGGNGLDGANGRSGANGAYAAVAANGTNGAGRAAAGQPAVYKIKDDSRITPAGKFLRRASLDELPQLINVLRGEMSLVGPRPAIPYEFQQYDIWHRRRVLEVKPGITGIWQVEGRSRVKFNDMVRLDLLYARSWSPWLDLKILFRTPRAVLTGSGAY